MSPGHDGRAGMAAVTLNEGYCLESDTLKKLYDHVMKELSPQARPIFVRNLGEPVVTSTFKQRKVELAAQGYDISRISDTIYVLDPRHSTYTRLTSDAIARLATSKL